MNMTSHWATRACAVVALLAASSCVPGKDEPPPKLGEIDISIRPTLLDDLERMRPETMMVFEVVDVDPDRWLDRLAEVTSVKGEVQQRKGLLEINEGTRHLEVRSVSGAAFYGDMALLWREAPTPDRLDFDLPSPALAKRSSWQQLQGFGFVPEDLLELEIAVADSLFEITLPDKPDGVLRTPVGRTVEVSRRIDNFPVVGPGSKIKLYYGDGGELHGYTVVWRQINPRSAVFGHVTSDGELRGEPAELISAFAAYERFRDNPLDNLPLAAVDRIDIAGLELAYYARSAVEPQRYLQPVYVFSGDAYATSPEGERRIVPFEQFVVAIDGPREPIWPEREMRESDSERRPMPTDSFKDEDEGGG
jgi:hypothetical protein